MIPTRVAVSCAEVDHKESCSLEVGDGLVGHCVEDHDVITNDTCNSIRTRVERILVRTDTNSEEEAFIVYDSTLGPILTREHSLMLPSLFSCTGDCNNYSMKASKATLPTDGNYLFIV